MLACFQIRTFAWLNAREGAWAVLVEIDYNNKPLQEKCWDTTHGPLSYREQPKTCTQAPSIYIHNS